ncbi:hypothetical protein [Streptomyces purpurogeneiscleroticus]|uniref:hypothetical protein n=1 Tax=Streptomyces purpurogeneiscleroticus TaxID=68259 RepID=UPI001CC01669|nr:hypothetical protein [Streptomyces purpurogeneiscleroticus]MBZ4017496.1 hypothetical protein [Streptomyces purpurogeneiscleroticus]
MNKIGLLLSELHDAETDFATACRKTAERQAADHGTSYPCRTIAPQCDTHAARVRAIAERFGKRLTPPRRPPAPVSSAMDSVRRTSSVLLGRRPESGLLLLRDLRQLSLAAQAVNVHWIYLGQVAQAVRDQDLLTEVTAHHKETLTHIKWIKTRMKEAGPQALTVTD